MEDDYHGDVQENDEIHLILVYDGDDDWMKTKQKKMEIRTNVAGGDLKESADDEEKASHASNEV